MGMTLSAHQKRQRMLERNTQMEEARRPYLDLARDITEYLCPYAGRYQPEDRNRRRNTFQSIIDSTALHALQVLQSGMMAMRTSPARPWFRIQTPDARLNRRHGPRQWLYDAAEVMQGVMRKSNTYMALPHLYTESGLFGTGGSIMAQDFDTVVHHHRITFGEYVCATDWRGDIDTLYRRFQMSVAECVRQFGIENVSQVVRNAWENNQQNSAVQILHVIEPRPANERGSLMAAQMPWKSCYYDIGDESGRALRESGHRRFPALVPRWMCLSNDVWGIGCGAMTIGDVRQLQIMQTRFAEAVDYQTRPPLQVPYAVINRDRDLLPGGKVPYDQNGPSGGVRTAFNVDLRLDFMLSSIKDVQDRIRTAFHVPLFQTLTSLGSTTQRTAEEIIQRKDEALPLLGPITQQLQRDLDMPLIQMIFERCLEAGLFPPPPPELENMELEIEFVGPLAQALKIVGAQSIDRFTGQLGVIAQIKPDVLDKFDQDQWADIYSDMFGIDPRLIVPGEKVALVRDARNQAMAAKEQAAMMQQGASAVRDLAGAPTSEDNAYTDMAAAIDQMRGVTTPPV